MVFFLTAPLGIVLGAMTGFIIACYSQGQADLARHFAATGGGILVVLFLLSGLLVFSGTQRPSILQRLEATVFWFGLPLLWSALLVIAGFWIFAGQ